MQFPNLVIKEYYPILLEEWQEQYNLDPDIGFFYWVWCLNALEAHLVKNKKLAVTGFTAQQNRWFGSTGAPKEIAHLLTGE